MADVSGGPTFDSAAAIAETHVGMVVLIGDRAYKSKKPVRTAFLDFSTPARRTAALHRELELNRRISPRTSTWASAGSPVRTARTRPVLVMRRMPADRRLSTLVSAGAPVRDELRDLARLMAAFHTRAGRGPGIAVDGGAAALRGAGRPTSRSSPATGTACCPDDVVDEVGRAGDLRFVDGRDDLLDAALRARAGGGRARRPDRRRRVLSPRRPARPGLPRLRRPPAPRRRPRRRRVPGHGPGTARARRPGRGLPRRLRRVLRRPRPHLPAPPLHRLPRPRAGQGGVSAPRPDRRGRRRRRRGPVRRGSSRAHLRAGAVRLALVGGLPGTGKSTIAGALADRLRACCCSSDRIRKELAGLDPAGRRSRRIPARASTRRAYTEALCRHLLRPGGGPARARRVGRPGRLVDQPATPRSRRRTAPRAPAATSSRWSAGSRQPWPRSASTAAALPRRTPPPRSRPRWPRRPTRGRRRPSSTRRRPSTAVADAHRRLERAPNSVRVG